MRSTSGSQIAPKFGSTPLFLAGIVEQMVDPRSGTHRMVFIGATIVGSWLGMQMVHELGHVLGAWWTGGEVVRVVLHPLTISRTDVTPNRSPGVVVWAGPLVGVLLPLAVWIAAAIVRMPGAYWLRFFAGFCLIANGLYIGLGAFGGVGDCGEMLRYGSQPWQLWTFGMLTAPVGLWLWHGEGKNFGLGWNAEPISPAVAYTSLAASFALFVLMWLLGAER